MLHYGQINIYVFIEAYTIVVDKLHVWIHVITDEKKAIIRIWDKNIHLDCPNSIYVYV